MTLLAGSRHTPTTPLPGTADAAPAVDHPGADAFSRLAMDLAAVPDDAFLTAFVGQAAGALGLDHVIVGRLNRYANMIRTVVYWHGGRIRPSVTYSLDQTPCARVIDHSACTFPDHVAERFPNDRMLTDIGARGYAGVPFTDEAGDPLGIIAGLSSAPLPDPCLCTRVFDTFKTRVAAAVVRDEAVTRLGLLLDRGDQAYFDWDLGTGGVAVSANIALVLGVPQARAPQDLSDLTDLVAPDSRHAFREFVYAPRSSEGGQTACFPLGADKFAKIALSLYRVGAQKGSGTRIFGVVRRIPA